MTDPSDPGPGAGPSTPDRGADPGTAELSYEAARTELAAVVERLEAGGCTLEEALALWERGEALARICQHRLDGARARLDSSTQQRETQQEEGSGGPAADR